jgi:hypothetical protein
MGEYQLRPDMRGVLWDAVLYIPTVSFLAFYGLSFWYANQHTAWAYALWFLASFFLIAGLNRILRRLLVLRGAPLRLDLDKKRRISVHLKGGQRVDLAQDVRYFKDYAGRSFGLSGADAAGNKWQFIFHQGQFEDQASYTKLNGLLEMYSG